MLKGVQHNILKDTIKIILLITYGRIADKYTNSTRP